MLISKNMVEIDFGGKDPVLKYDDIVKIGKDFGYDLTKGDCGYCFYDRIVKGKSINGLRFFR